LCSERWVGEIAVRKPGPDGFGTDYWSTVYKTPGHIDGHANGDIHCAYLKSLFKLDMAIVSSIADFGFGEGGMLQAFIAGFQPRRAYGIEPSQVAFDRAEQQHWTQEGVCVKLEQIGLRAWSRRPPGAWSFFDLGVANSVFQYLPDRHLEEVVPVMAKRLKWLYMTVPTADEYQFMKQQTGFVDQWAHRRPSAYYRTLFGAHFDFIGSRLLESKHAFKGSDSPFTERLFRF